MNVDERRKLENQLMVMGLNRLEDPELVPQMAAIINQWGGHDFFEAMLGECDASKRTEMYEALRPHLKFKPLPLEQYITHIKEHAANVASASEPIQVGTQKFMEVLPEDADACIATLTCYKCTRTEDFVGASPVDAAVKARSAGWVRDLVKQKEICPKCPSAFGRTMHRVN